MDRVFLDANVIFSAAYNLRRRISILWTMPDVELVTSDYAAAQALRNIRRKYPNRFSHTRQLLSSMRIVRSRAGIDITDPTDLPENDRPILQAAISSRSDYLLTGDDDFLPYFGRVIEGVLILRPGDYLRLRGM